MIPERLLLGPGPSPVSTRVLDAMHAPVLSHVDPVLLAMLDDIRGALGRVFQAAPGSLALAISGTGTSGMEAAIANVTPPGARAVVAVSGYFGDRLARILERYGAHVRRVDGEWGRACDPAALEAELAREGADIVALVHAETSTGVLNPAAELCAIARTHGALTIVDAVTSLGAVPVDAAGWGADVVYSCTQKGLGAPSGMAPIVFSERARAVKAARSFYLDLQLLEDYWVGRKYHHTISAPLVYALREALLVVEEEGLRDRWERHRRTHERFVAALAEMGLELLPPEGERLWSLNTVKVPGGVDEAAVRRNLLERYSIEIGAGLGPLAGRVWRVGFMGSGATDANVATFMSALRSVLQATRQ